jgi:hypothetical protein
MTVACDDMNSIIQDDLNKGEAIYPGAIAYIYAYPGKEKAKLYWYYYPDSRIAKTVITWDGGKVEKPAGKGEASSGVITAGLRRDSIDITGLAEGTYTFMAYTEDKDGHRSIDETSFPVYVYGNTYTRTLSPRAFASSDMLTSGTLRITWQNALPNMLYSIVTYPDHRDNPDGVLTTVDTVRNSAATTDLPGLKRLKPFTIRTVFRIGYFNDTVSVTGRYYPSVVEKTLLEANGLTELTDEAALRITKLTFPLSLEGWTFRDLYFFPNLRELDLTPGTESLPEYTYEGNGVTSTVGGGPWLYFASGYMSDTDRAILTDLLASGQLTKVKYTRNSYPRVDDVLEMHSSNMTVEWIPAAPLPDELMIPANLLLDYRVAESGKGATVVHSEDGSIVPADIAAKFSGDLTNVYKVTVTAQNSTIAFSLPSGVQFGFVPHGNLKFDAYIDTPNDADYSWMKPAATSKYASWNQIRRWRETRLSQFPESSKYTNGSTGPEGAVSWDVDTELGTWKSHSWALQSVPQEHRMLIRLQFGNDAVWGLPGGQSLSYYIANLRWTK